MYFTKHINHFGKYVSLLVYKNIFLTKKTNSNRSFNRDTFYLRVHVVRVFEYDKREILVILTSAAFFKRLTFPIFCDNKTRVISRVKITAR